MTRTEALHKYCGEEYDLWDIDSKGRVSLKWLVFVIMELCSEEMLHFGSWRVMFRDSAIHHGYSKRDVMKFLKGYDGMCGVNRFVVGFPEDVCCSSILIGENYFQNFEGKR